MRWLGLSTKGAFIVLGMTLVTVVAVRAVGTSTPSIKNDIPSSAPAPADEVARGRLLMINHACGECHGGGEDPAAKGWLAGSMGPDTEFKIGPPPCGTDPKAKGCFTTRPRNLTADNETGMGRFTERQLFNALRYGLRPENTPDVDITSTTPGKGNFPQVPHYLAPPMPWPAWRHMSDADLKAIAAYIKRGLKPVVNKVVDSEGPPDFWASEMVPANIGTYPAAAFPTANETPASSQNRARVLHGRQLVMEHGCADCHRSQSPASAGWLAGITSPAQEFVVGPCFADPNAPCFNGRPRNLTADKDTGIGKYSDQQIFNALRYGLRPSDTPDVKITSNKPGEGNFPKEPHYLGPFMPWMAWRYMSDDELWSIIAYLRQLKPVSNKVEASFDMPDHWAGFFATLPGLSPAAFPTANEIKR